jgi:signal transduction histidine kinase
MNIRLRLLLSFISLMAIGIMLTVSIALIFIQEYLFDNRLQRMEKEAAQLTALIHRTDASQWPSLLRFQAQWQTHQLLILDNHQKPLINTLKPTDSLALAPMLWPAISQQPPNEPIGKRMGAHLVVANRIGSADAETLLVMVYPKREVGEYFKPMRWIIYISMFISIGLIAVSAVYYTHRFIQPILRIQQTTERIAAGNFQLLSTESQRKDELGVIARAIDRMAQNLKADNQRLQDLYQRQAQFYADITHEVRNPLHILTTTLEMLAIQAPLTEKSQRYVETAQNQVARMSRLFGDLMLLQRSDSDPHFIHRRIIDLQPLFSRLLLSYQDAMAAKGLYFEIPPDHMRLASIDPDKMEQVLDNLVSNALKFTAKGHVTVSCQSIGNSWRIAVSDSGAGIAAEHLPNLTNRFYRTDYARTRDRGGTGLGLSVVERILAAHDTTLHIDSQLGKGTTIWFEVPMSSTNPQPAS